MADEKEFFGFSVTWLNPTNGKRLTLETKHADTVSEAIEATRLDIEMSIQKSEGYTEVLEAHELEVR